jgi:hypothetical protein
MAVSAIFTTKIRVKRSKLLHQRIKIKKSEKPVACRALDNIIRSKQIHHHEAPRTAYAS